MTNCLQFLLIFSDILKQCTYSNVGCRYNRLIDYQNKAIIKLIEQLIEFGSSQRVFLLLARYVPNVAKRSI